MCFDSNLDQFLEIPVLLLNDNLIISVISKENRCIY